MPTSIEIEQQIADLQREIAEAQAEQGEIEQQIASNWDGDTSPLEQRYAALTARLKAAPLRQAALERQKISALVAEKEPQLDALIERAKTMLAEKQQFTDAVKAAEDDLLAAQQARAQHESALQKVQHDRGLLSDEIERLKTKVQP